MQNSAPCAESAQFHRYLDDALTPVEEVTLIRHLDVCLKCQHQLEQTAGQHPWWDEVREFLGSASSIDQDDDNPLTQPADPRIQLSFLAPTDDPAMLGRLGVYEIIGVVGQGGTGIVLKAFERSLNRYVAVKVLAPHLATSAAARQRFAREAQAAAAVVEEHVVPIYAVDQHQGLPYLVMQYVAGRSLQERLVREGPLGIRETLRIGMQAAAGLAAAHAQGLVHRDVKPANILLERGIERVMLTDFGLARAVDDASQTASGVIAGTPQYMAPEQARGEAIDYRADLFSLGSVLYATCTGHSPFRAETAVGVLHRVCNDMPRPVRELNADVPVWLERIIRRLHAKQPDRRYQSAKEVADVLGRHLARIQQPAGVRPLWRDRLVDSMDLLRDLPRRTLVLCGIATLIGGIALAELGRVHPWMYTPASPITVAEAHDSPTAATMSSIDAESPFGNEVDDASANELWEAELKNVSQQTEVLATKFHLANSDSLALWNGQLNTQFRHDAQGFAELPELSRRLTELEAEFDQLDNSSCLPALSTEQGNEQAWQNSLENADRQITELQGELRIELAGERPLEPHSNLNADLGRSLNTEAPSWDAELRCLQMRIRNLEIEFPTSNGGNQDAWGKQLQEIQIRLPGIEQQSQNDPPQTP